MKKYPKVIELHIVLERLEKVASSCAAGGHTMRAKMFRALAKEFSENQPTDKELASFDLFDNGRLWQSEWDAEHLEAMNPNGLPCMCRLCKAMEVFSLKRLQTLLDSKKEKW